MPTLNTEKKHALLTLLEDSSSVVHQALFEEFNKLGMPGIHFLQEVAEKENGFVVQAAKQYLYELLSEQNILAFADYIQGFNYNLETGSFLLAKAFDSTFKEEKYKNYINEIAYRCNELMLDRNRPRDCLYIINKVFFQEFNFNCHANLIDLRATNFITQLIDSKKGSFLCLTVLYMLVCERCNITVHPVIFGGKTYVGYFNEKNPFYINMNKQGDFIESNEVHTLPGEMLPKGALLMPSTIGDLLYANCQLLELQFKANQQPELAELAKQFIHGFEKTHHNHE